MKKYRQLIKELPSRTAVFAFGRFNPPTVGHELLFKVVQKVAASHNADHLIVASKSQDAKKNPLSVDKKLHYLKMMFPGVNFMAANEQQRTFIEVAKELNKKYKSLIMVAGSDRVPEYEKLLQKYNGKEFHYDSIQVVSAGERDPDADDATGMSASKMRAAAVKGDFNTFKKGLPASIREIDGKLLMNDIRVGMNLDVIKEQVKFSVDELREKYYRKEIFNIGQFVESAGTQYEIIDRGSNYLVVVDNNGATTRKWIQDVTECVNPMVEDIRPGYAPAEVSFKGYTTKNLHHEPNVAKAFLDTIERMGSKDPAAVLNALKSTDTYMKLNDMHLEQGKEPDDAELKAWREAHGKARDWLVRLGEFMHHEDYWHMHEHEIQDMMGNYNPETAGAEMNEELTDKTIKPTDKLKVARMIASFLGNADAEKSSNPEQLVTTSLRKIKSKLTHTDSINMLTKMLALADEVGIKYDHAALPEKLKEAREDQVTVNKKSDYNFAAGNMQYKDFVRSLKMNKGIKEDCSCEENPEEMPTVDKEKRTKVGHTLSTDADSETLRRMKVRYKTEEVYTSDYKISPETGRKVHPKRINFANSGMKDKLEPEDVKEEAKKKSPVKDDSYQLGLTNSKGYDAFFEESEDEEDFTEDDLESMANSVTDVEHVLDAYDDDELAIIDNDSGEEIHPTVKEEVISEVLSRSERIRARVRFARTETKRERSTVLALKRHSSVAVINKRARRLAVSLMKQKLAKKPLEKLSVGEKERIERIMQNRKKAVDRLAMRLAPKVRKIEQTRLAHHKYTKE